MGRMSPPKMPTLRSGVNQQQQQRSTQNIKEPGNNHRNCLRMGKHVKKNVPCLYMNFKVQCKRVAFQPSTNYKLFHFGTLSFFIRS